MSLSDLLYYGNPERREKVIRRSQELIDLMKSNFEATNSLIEMVNKHLHSSFSPITLNEKATVKENWDVMIERVNHILAKVEEIDEELKKKLEPTLYESVQRTPLKDFNKFPAAVKIAISAVCQLSAAVLVVYLKKKKILTNLICRFYKIVGGLRNCIFFVLAVDVIVSAILGYIERAKLETALQEYDEALAELRPVSKEYKEAIYEVMFIIKYM